MILAIDPGNEKSAYVFMQKDTLKPIEFGILDNHALLDVIWENCADRVAIEMIASYGMVVGKEVFETCVWIGRFTEAAEIKTDTPVTYIYRKDEKVNLCGNVAAKDKNIRQALIDRFGAVGTKKNPEWFYGFKYDVWAAYAVGVTYADMKNGRYNP